MSTEPISVLLLFRNTGPETHAHLSPDERQQLVVRWNAWFDGLVAEGKAVEGQPLELATRVVSGPGGSRVVDGPFAEAKKGETVVFAWIVFKSRAHRDRVNAAVMKDPRIAEMCDPKNSPFDPSRMVVGGFKVAVSA